MHVFNIVVCDDYTFGPGCLTPCYCDEPCDDITGHCPGNCVPSKKGDNCQERKYDGLQIGVVEYSNIAHLLACHLCSANAKTFKVKDGWLYYSTSHR